MTEQTARRYNALREAAFPAYVRRIPEQTSDAAQVVVGGADPGWVVTTVHRLMAEKAPEAQAAELAAAAETGRKADAEWAPPFQVGSAGSVVVRVSGAGYNYVLWPLALPLIEAELAADNARRAAAFDALRLQCLRGTAAPPPLRPLTPMPGYSFFWLYAVPADAPGPVKVTGGTSRKALEPLLAALLADPAYDAAWIEDAVRPARDDAPEPAA